MSTSALPTERRAVVAVLPPLSSSGTRTTGYFSAAAAARFLVNFYVGANSAAGTFRLKRAADSAGTSAENASATVAYGGSSTTGDNILHQLTVNPGTYTTEALPYLAVEIAAGGTYVSSCVVEAVDERFTPTDDNAAVSVTTAPAVA